jgi:CheY-like chemotaxis protein
MYKRAVDVAEKIRDSRLKFDEWRVLFAVDSNSTPQKIADFLELSIEKVNNALAHLAESGLVLSEDQTAKPETKPEETAAVEEEVLFEEVTDEQEEGADEGFSDILEEVSESVTEEIIEEEPVAEEELIVEETESEEPVGEEEPVIEEEPAQEAAEEESVSAEASLVEEVGEEEMVLEEAPAAVEEPAVEEKAPEPVEEETPAEPEKEEAAPPAEEKTGDGGGSKTLLVVDDSIVIRKMVEIALENESLNIETAVSGKEALQKIDAVEPDLVILDIMLPDVSGIEILKAIKASKGIPVIMLSGKNSPQDIELAKAQGADDFAPKPFKEEELVEKIKALLK